MFIVETANRTPAIVCVRKITGESLAVIGKRIASGLPVLEVPFASTDWDEESSRLLALIERLDRESIPYRLFEGEFEVSATYVKNVVAESAEELRRQEWLTRREAGVDDT